ncbi:MAG TPA: isoprenylcysteine carboxylmethyltransferase family protein [Solirubrobacteraceae bacterium]|nr:isoprenylcysteine carboxylmethyltransferase family protein [Solirubrobacteraceae bacterium]
MPGLGIALLALYGLLALGVRSAAQLRRTGSTGFRGVRTGAGAVEWLAGSAFVTATVLCLAGSALQLEGALKPIGPLAGAGADVLGALCATAGIALTVAAQFAMGDAWRVGVDPDEHTELVTGGPFAIVRNPIYAAMIPAFAGIALLAPNPVTIAGAILLALALELQTRLIEEPYLLTSHGQRYASYAGQVGRFLPRIGRLRVQPERRL